MGSGQYGGNGSVHWKVEHGRGREIRPYGKDSCTGIDDDSGDFGGYFNVVVENVEAKDWTYDASTKTLRAKTVIKLGETYTKQVSVEWP